MKRKKKKEGQKGIGEKEEVVLGIIRKKEKG